MNTSPVSTQTGVWRERFGALRWASFSLLIIVLDQVTKAIVVAKLPQFRTHVVLPVLYFMQLHNEGAAFSFLANQSGWQRWFFIGLALVVSVGILAWLRRIDPRRQRLLAVALALILGGAIGNVVDRFALGYVIDFIVVHWGAAEFPAFNVADSAITIGAILLIVDALLEGRRARASAGAAPP